MLELALESIESANFTRTVMLSEISWDLDAEIGVFEGQACRDLRILKVNFHTVVCIYS